MDELADQLDLVADGLTLRARPGERVAFGNAAGVAATIRPDGGAITFSAAADLFRKWTIGVRATIGAGLDMGRARFRDDPTDRRSGRTTQSWSATVRARSVPSACRESPPPNR